MFLEMVKGVDLVWSQQETLRWKYIIQNQKEIIDSIVSTMISEPSVLKESFIKTFLPTLVLFTELHSEILFQNVIESGVERCGALEVRSV